MCDSVPKETGVMVKVASSFTSAPLESTLRSTVVNAGVADELDFVQYSQMSAYMLSSAVDSEMVLGTVVLLRIEDWLRDRFKSLPAGSTSESDKQIARGELRERIDEFVDQLGNLALRGKQVWFLACPSTGWVAKRHNLEALFRTYTNLVRARAGGRNDVTLLQWPKMSSEGDAGADRLGQIPFTQDAFDQLGQSVGNQMLKTLKHRTPMSSAAGLTELASYVKSLDVHVALTVARRSDHYHVDRLLRTAAAFSLAGERWDLSDSEVDALIDGENCMLINVRDRLSNQGPSGIVAAREAGDDLVVDAFSLSCSVLGKQVEHATVSALARRAAERGLSSVVFQYQPAGRNQPMRAFLEALTRRNASGCYALPTGTAETRLAAASVSAGAWTVE